MSPEMNSFYVTVAHNHNFLSNGKCETTRSLFQLLFGMIWHKSQNSNYLTFLLFKLFVLLKNQISEIYWLFISFVFSGQ
jgi:hypothetical protein